LAADCPIHGTIAAGLIRELAVAHSSTFAALRRRYGFLPFVAPRQVRRLVLQEREPIEEEISYVEVPLQSLPYDDHAFATDIAIKQLAGGERWLLAIARCEPNLQHPICPYYLRYVPDLTTSIVFTPSYTS
jgi:hypothetical protein